MHLYLVQHAKAKSKSEDPERPLSQQGHTDISKMAVYAAERANIQVDKILHSGKLRAQQTAEILANALLPSTGATATEDLGATDDPTIWAKKLVSSEENIMLVGHMPYMSKMAALLLCGIPDNEIVSFENAGIVALAYEGDNWSLQWAVVPQLLD